MRRLFLLFSLILSGISNAMADAVIVVVYDKNGLAVAAESRQGDGEASGTSDRACKILPLGDKMFFAAAAHSLPAPEGGAAAGSESAWIYGEAQVAFHQWQTQGGKVEDQTSVEAVAENWKRAIQEVLEDTFTAQPESFVQMPRDGYLLRGVFGGLDENGDIALIVVSVKPQKPPSFEVFLEHLTPGSKLDYVVLGKSDIAREFLELQTARARSEAAQQESELASVDADAQLARRAARLVDLTIGMQPPDQSTIGGPIDILQMRAGGQIDWLQRKESCTSVR
jgi:hypothetical protein